MKNEQRSEARRLRSEGASVKAIERQVGVSRASVSRWVRDVPLTDEQKENLRPCGVAAGKSIRKHFAEKRLAYRKEGSIKAMENDVLHAMGCMLYWAEGHHTNNKTGMRFSNSDVSMVRLFLSFLRSRLRVSDDEISIYINCYTDRHNVKEIESYWIKELGLPSSCLRKTIADYRPACTKMRRNGILEWGTCRLVVNDVRIIQHIYGAIQQYSGAMNSKWE
jgi:hypothetical protein